MLVGFEHVGMTSRNMPRTLEFYCGLLGLTVAYSKSVDAGEIVFLNAGGGMLEIICPKAPHMDGFRDVPPYEAGMRHVTFAVTDVDAMFERLVAAGAPIVERPRPPIYPAMMKRVAFVRDPDGILVELVERAEGR